MPADQNFDRFGFFLPTTTLWDTNPLSKEPFSAASVGELILRLYQQMNNFAVTINAKDTAMYLDQEFVPGQQWFPNPNAPTRSQSRELRQAFRKVVNFGALPNAGLKSVPHGIPINTGAQPTRVVRLYGAATNTSTGQSLPIPHVSVFSIGQGVQLALTGPNININTGTTNRSAFDHCVVVIEYLQN